MTQQQADLIRLVNARNGATSPAMWETYQRQLDTLWRAMGYPAASPLCQLADEELIFPAVRAALDGDGDVRRSASLS